MTISQRVIELPWSELHTALDAQGFAQTPAVLTAGECRELRRLYENGSFRSTVTMARHRFGEGEYRYFDHPLPDAVSQLREASTPRSPRQPIAGPTASGRRRAIRSDCRTI
jgi:uncharacterized protein